MRTKHVILIVLFLISGIFYYQITDTVGTTTAKVIRVIDGDTLYAYDTKGLLIFHRYD